jgi:hypothetical protein
VQCAGTAEALNGGFVSLRVVSGNNGSRDGSLGIGSSVVEAVQLNILVRLSVGEPFTGGSGEFCGRSVL